MKKLLSLIVCVLMISGCQDASINRIKKDNSYQVFMKLLMMN